MRKQGLIKRCLKQDKQAWGVFVDEYSRLVYWAIQKRLATTGFEHNQADIDDIFQEVFVAVLQDAKLSQLREPKKLSAWLVMISSNKTISFMRKKSIRERSFDPDIVVFRDNSFDQKLLAKDELSVVKDVIDSFSDKEKRVISFCLLEEKTHQQIAEILNISVNSVSTIVARAKEKLKKQLQNRGIGENF